MAEIMEIGRGVSVGPRAETRVTTSDRGYQAYRVLQAGFVLAPTIAGVDKFFHLLVNWDQYLAPQIASLLPLSAHAFMRAVGVIEIAAGFLVAVKPRIGAYVVAAWLGGIVVNLLISGTYFDIALRDFGLMIGAFALGLLSEAYAGRRRISV